MNYYSALIKSGKILEGYFEQSKNILHNGSKGTVRENIVNKVIRPFLPACYGLSGGEAFDSEGNTSKQLDLVVYDSVFSYIIPYIDNYIQFPCESIYGNIEIKSFLNKDELMKAIDNIKSMKSLKREGTHSWTVTPLVSIKINGLPDNTDRNPYFGIIFAYDSVEALTVLNYLENLDIPSNLLPNAIVLYSKRTIIFQATDSNIEGFPSNDFNKYVMLNCGEETLAVFIGLLINFTRYSLLWVADVPKEINKALERILNDNIRNKSIKEISVLTNK
ncbi:MAG: hypothetical protein K1W27_12500 [Lachnospiraceae bacterium]|jgi:hypothetical protein|uniref:DUF6602 domain-containing protein n=1 Tax=Bacteroides acidifaciens TaxID=85831 RepID=UPI0027149D42|nr:DUF6602 domain-containing protein [Bacteroides acidifaciens]MCI8883895.1 hypothetical protein [Lachnospiraceae bacterium]MCI9675691.1 hypothetical protein [Lachnospiraceae bacterium]